MFNPISILFKSPEEPLIHPVESALIGAELYLRQIELEETDRQNAFYVRQARSNVAKARAEL